MDLKKKCTDFCPDAGYCANRCNGDCMGFNPMESWYENDEDSDEQDEMIERMTY